MLKVSDEHAGEKVRCPGCRSVVTAPRSPGRKRSDDTFHHTNQTTGPEQTSSRDKRRRHHESHRDPQFTDGDRTCPVCDGSTSREATFCRQCGSRIGPEGAAEKESQRNRDRTGQYQREQTRPRSDPKAFLIFLLGIIGCVVWVTAPIVGPVAMILGNRHRKKVREGVYRKSGWAAAGWILGMFETGISLLVVGLFVLAILAA